MLVGVVLGRGHTGLVLAQGAATTCVRGCRGRNVSPSGGYQALAFDFEGFGGSRRGSGPDARIDTDVAAAVEQLGRRGADRIVLIGSSMGATATLVVVRHGHGASMLAYHDQGPRVLATVHRFVADHTGR
jgi:pimeloyl-ACP methyl ester carboxylesterase